MSLVLSQLIFSTSLDSQATSLSWLPISSLNITSFSDPISSKVGDSVCAIAALRFLVPSLFIHYKYSKAISYPMASTVLHPMVKLQRKISSLVASNVVKPTDKIWKIAFLYGDDWGYWKSELEDFGFSTHDPIKDLLVVETWEDS